MTKFFNKTSEKANRLQLRKNPPKTEVIVWSKLKGRQMLGYKFRRQYSVGTYVIDFYCPTLKLAVEIDGHSHFERDAAANDKRRQAFIESFGVQFLRFTNDEVSKNMDGVLETVKHAVEVRSGEVRLEETPLSPPLRKRCSG